MSFLHKVEFLEDEKKNVDLDAASIIEDPESLSKWEKCNKCCVESYHPTKKFPIIVWIKDYKPSYIIRDIVAGMTSFMSHYLG